MAKVDIDEVESPPVDANEGGKDKRRTRLIVGGVLLLIVLAALAAGGWWFFYKRSAPRVAGTAAATEKAAEVYLPLEPAFVVNFQDDATRYLQVGVTLMSSDAAAIQVVKSNDPVVRNALVLLFSSQTFDELSTTAGKQKLQSEALNAVRKIVAVRLGRPGIDALYFTSFVMQ